MRGGCEGGGGDAVGGLRARVQGKGHAQCRWVLRTLSWREGHWISFFIIINEYAKWERTVFPPQLSLSVRTLLTRMSASSEWMDGDTGRAEPTPQPAAPAPWGFHQPILRPRDFCCTTMGSAVLGFPLLHSGKYEMKRECEEYKLLNSFNHKE